MPQSYSSHAEDAVAAEAQLQKLPDDAARPNRSGR
jgi:hypothetical protein